MRGASSIVTLIALLHLGCSRSHSTVEMLAHCWIFLGPADTHELSSGGYVLSIPLTPAEEPDGDKMCKLLRAGHPVSLRLREEPDQPPILVSSVTDQGAAIFQCSRLAEAQHIQERIFTCAGRH